MSGKGRRGMFEVGEYVVYGMKGVCRIEDITHIDMTGADKERLYYVLVPTENGGGRIYAPTDNPKVMMRRVILREEADALIEEIPQIEPLWVSDDRQREAVYKEALNTGDYRAWVSIVKTLYLRKKERISQGKKITALDERYMRAAENELFSELSLALEIPKTEVYEYIIGRLEMK